MKINKITLTNLLSFFIICIISMSDITCSIKTQTVMTKLNERDDSLSSNLMKENKKQHINKHKNHKKLQRFKLKSEESNKIKEEENSKEKEETIKKPSDSFIYVSWFIFVPLVLLIFVMTILSIAGFLILILNSQGSQAHNNNLNQIGSFRNAEINRPTLTNNEILELLKYKQQMLKKKMKSAKNTNYKPEPEPEGAVIKG